MNWLLTALTAASLVQGLVLIWLVVRVQRYYGAPVVKMPSPEVRALIDKMIKRNRDDRGNE